MDKNLALGKIKTLIGKYETVVKEGRIDKYNEEMTKKDFILPLFDALGWKTSDSREVSAEEKVSKKKVDYGFRINNILKFFLEAKSFKEDLDNRKYIEQAISYSWHKGCTWAVLSNFESIKIFNAEIKTEHPWLSQLKPTFHCKDFITHFDELYLLSRESLEQGLLDREAEKWGKKAKKASIGTQLFEDFTHFRDILSKNIIKLNPNMKLSREELDEAVQRLLDRLIFIRNCEDRELEPKTLIGNYREWESKGKGQLIRTLRNVFADYDERYNSEIFGRHLADELDIDNEVLHQVIQGLYFTKDESPYDFSAIEADVLGTIYEQYLGHVLKKTSKRAVLADNHVHRKEQGIYYTPTFVVEYIVQHTLGELLQKKVDVEEVRILDPTCGSGSFLIKAFDYFDKYYLKKEKDYNQTQLDMKTGLPFKTKERILRNNIFGVDIDEKAVEIARLNLLLRIAERGHKLPLLKTNIKCGDSLIDGKIAGNKAFNWREKFPSIIVDEGGFDVIIGNPPYVHQKGEKDSPMISFEEREYFKKNYDSLSNEQGKTRGGIKLNLFIPYVERCVKLLKENGKLGFIVHKNLLKVESYKFLRRFILNNCAIEKIVDLGAGVFKEVTGETIIVILKKESDKEKRTKNEISVIYGLTNESELISGAHPINKIKQQLFEDAVDNMFTIYVSSDVANIRNKMEQGTTKLEDAVKIVSFGLNTSDNKKYFIESKVNEKYKKAVMGRDIEKWIIKNRNKFVYYDQKVLTRIGDVEAFLSKEKLIMQRIGAGLIVAYDDEQYYCYNSTNMILPKDRKFNLKYILALLNSELFDFYYRLVFGTKAGLTVNVTQGYLSQLPIKIASPEITKEMIKMVNRLLSLKRREVELKDKDTDEKTELKEKIMDLELSLNELVYKIYRITERERKTIEDTLK